MEMAVLAGVFVAGGIMFGVGVFIGSQESWNDSPRADDETITLVKQLVTNLRSTKADEYRRRELIDVGDRWLRDNGVVRRRRGPG